MLQIRIENEQGDLSWTSTGHTEKLALKNLLKGLRTWKRLDPLAIAVLGSSKIPKGFKMTVVT